MSQTNQMVSERENLPRFPRLGLREGVSQQHASPRFDCGTGSFPLGAPCGPSVLETRHLGNIPREMPRDALGRMLTSGPASAAPVVQGSREAVPGAELRASAASASPITPPMPGTVPAHLTPAAHPGCPPEVWAPLETLESPTGV